MEENWIICRNFQIIFGGFSFYPENVNICMIFCNNSNIIIESPLHRFSILGPSVNPHKMDYNYRIIAFLNVKTGVNDISNYQTHLNRSQFLYQI